MKDVVRWSHRLGLCLAFTLVAACGGQDEALPEPMVRPVKSMVVGAADGVSRRVFPGKIRAAKQVDLSFQVAGQLRELKVLNGQTVARDEILAELDDRDFVSNLKAAEAEFSLAQADFERSGALVKRQLVSRSEYDQMRAQRDIAEANVERARKALSDTRLRAPFAGVVAHRYVENFQDINAKQPIVSLQNSVNLEVVINIPENSILTLNENRDFVTISAAFDSLPGRSFPLTVKEYSTDTNPTTQSYEVVLLMERPADVNLFPGMTASVTAELQTPQTQTASLWIPLAAVFADREGKDSQYVWVVNPQTLTVARREVSTGGLRSDQVEITGGLHTGERIVTAGVHYLQADDKIRLPEVAGE